MSRLTDPQLAINVVRLCVAYVSGRLIHGEPCACAVGTLIAATKGVEAPSEEHVVTRKSPWMEQMMAAGAAGGEAWTEEGAAGYSWMQLHLVEQAFENNRYRGPGNEALFGSQHSGAGLECAVRMLCRLHQADEGLRELALQLVASAREYVRQHGFTEDLTLID